MPFKQRVPGSIPGRLTYVSGHLRAAPRRGEPPLLPLRRPPAAAGTPRSSMATPMRGFARNALPYVSIVIWMLACPICCWAYCGSSSVARVLPKVWTSHASGRGERHAPRIYPFAARTWHWDPRPASAPRTVSSTGRAMGDPRRPGAAHQTMAGLDAGGGRRCTRPSLGQTDRLATVHTLHALPEGALVRNLVRYPWPHATH